MSLSCYNEIIEIKRQRNATVLFMAFGMRLASSITSGADDEYNDLIERLDSGFWVFGPDLEELGRPELFACSSEVCVTLDRVWGLQRWQRCRYLRLQRAK